MFIYILFLIGVILYYTLRYLIELIPLNPSKISERAVFITGCDSGFGRALALKCAKNGIPVYAGVYTLEVSSNFI